VRVAADGDDLIDRLPLGSVFTADVADVASAGGCRDLGERDDLGWRGIDPGVVLETGRKPERTGGHLGAQEILHLADFVGGRRSFEVVTHHLMPDRAVTDIGRHVHGSRLGTKPLEVLG